MQESVKADQGNDFVVYDLPPALSLHTSGPTLRLTRQELSDISVLLQMRVNTLRDLDRPAFAAELDRAESAMSKITAWLERTEYPEIIEPSKLESAISKATGAAA